MLAKFLNLFGFDLHRQIWLVKNQIQDVSERAAAEAKIQVKDIGLMVAFGAGAGLMLLFTFVIGLIALYTWVDQNYGTYPALGALALVTIVLAGILFALASARGKATRNPLGPIFQSLKRSEPPKPLSYAPPPPPARDPPSYARSEVPLAVGDLHPSLKSAVQEFFSHIPRTGSPADGVLDRMTEEAVAASGKTVDAAADVMRSGSRPAVFGVLAASFALGWFLSRNDKTSFSWSGLKSQSGQG
jgi:hypothetical protein